MKWKEWNVRLLIELSKAIKCPTVNYHLAGAKRIQQALFEPDTVEKYISNEETSSKIRSIFVDQYSFKVYIYTVNLPSLTRSKPKPNRKCK